MSKPVVAINPGSTVSLAFAAIESGFSGRPDLRKRIAQVIEKQSDSVPYIGLFGDIGDYILQLRSAIPARPKEQDEDEEEEAAAAEKKNNKKRKLGDDVEAPRPDALHAVWAGAPVVEGVSFSIPQRKKLSLQISARKDEGIRALNPTSGRTEFGIPWHDVGHVLCLPVPEKAQPARGFCVFPAAGDAPPREPMVWTVPDAKTKDEEAGPAEKTIEAIEAAAGVKVVQPSDKEFVSQAQQAARKGEKAYHVKAFRGSKDGYLFFLATGIAFVFKKPLLFFPFAAIGSVSYTSVLQRTFNLNLGASSSSSASSPPAQEFEFSMLDQADFAAIDAYVRRHGLHDASMAEQRRAKKLNVNPPKGGEDGAADGEGELARAQREAGAGGGGGDGDDDDDDDEEDDENFDPGSEGESEGSGTSDEEDGSGDEGGGEEGSEEEGLVERELGSEAEDVDDDDDDDDDEK